MTPVGIHVCDQSGAADVVVSLGDDATVADVFDVLGLPAQTLVDGQPIASPATTAAREVLHGVFRSGPVNRRERHRRRSKDSSTLVWWQDLMQAPACDSGQDSFIYCRMGQAPRAVGCCKSTLAIRCLVRLDLGMNKGNTSRHSNDVASPSLL